MSFLIKLWEYFSTEKLYKNIPECLLQVKSFPFLEQNYVSIAITY